MPGCEEQQVVEEDVSGELYTAASLTGPPVPIDVPPVAPLLGELPSATPVGEESVVQEQPVEAAAPPSDIPLVDETPSEESVVQEQSVEAADPPSDIPLVDEPPVLDQPTDPDSVSVDVSYHPFISN